MAGFFATLIKDLLLLRRDRAGLAVLFLMPAVLVVVIALVQDNLYRETAATGLRLLVVNQDTGEVGARLVAGLRELPAFAVVPAEDAAASRRQVAAGQETLLLELPADLSVTLEQRARTEARQLLKGEPSPELPPLVVPLYADPALQAGFRVAVQQALARLLQAEEFRLRRSALARLLPAWMERELTRSLGPTMARAVDLQGIAGLESAPLTPLVRLQPQGASVGPRPTSVQYNVPAWSLFGIFFIVVPLSATLLRERQLGTLCRLRVAPAPVLGQMLGRALVYLGVCLLQFALMLLLGRTLLPTLGTPVLTVAGAPTLVLAAVLASGLAAVAYGILVGTLATSTQQASLLGAVSVVIAAALGGVMVPVALMPAPLQSLSLLSPLGWGLSAMVDLFVRGAGLAQVGPKLAALVGFALLCLLAAWAAETRRARRGT